MRVIRIERETETAVNFVRAKSPMGKPAFDARLPLRPGFGTRGREVLLWANYLDLMAFGDLLLFRYSIEILPDQRGRTPTGKKVKRVVQLLLEEHLAQYGHDIATDFKSNLISKTELDLDEDCYEIHYKAEDEDDPAPNARIYQIRLQPTGALTVSELMDYLTSSHSGALFGSKDEIIQALNIVVGNHPKAASYTASVGANKHFHLAAATSERFDLGAGLLALRGFFVSVRAATARILVNVQVKHAAFYDDGPLDKLMLTYIRTNGPSTVKLGNFLKKLSINVTHIVKKNRSGSTIPRIKVVLGLATRDDGRGQQNPPIVLEFGSGPKDVKFFLGDRGQGPAGRPQVASATNGNRGRKAAKLGPEPPSQGQYISVYDFFRQTHDITIKDPTLPVINVGSRQNPQYLPPEVCEVLPGQTSNTKLSSSQTQQMIRFAVRKPAQNAQSIATSGTQMLGFEPTNSTLGNFGINVMPKLIVVPGRVLNSPDVNYGRSKIANPRFGSWNMQSFEVATKADLTYWTYLRILSQGSFDPWRDDTSLNTSLNAFTSTLRQVGINANDCVPGLHMSVTAGNVEAEIAQAIHRFTSNPTKPPPKLLLVIMPSTDTTIYNSVKYACDVKEGLLNVCVVAEKFARANSQYFANVALKVNLKLGGRNQFLDNSKLGILAEGKTMVVGIDVTHPSPGSSSNAPSVASIVASVDRWLAQWPADLQIQTAQQELVSGLDSLFKSRLHLWMKRNDSYPENILVYRDGVSEGEYHQVLDQELPALRKACEELYPAFFTKQGIPYITIIIVGKRHNTRFYPTKKEDVDRSSNPQNGTVVDRGVTEARNWDFYLQAHTAIQGTARPAHYYTIYDEIFRCRMVQQPFRSAADIVEDLTHNLCYLFGRATKAVSICPPAYYADLVCERARCYLSGLFDPTPTASPTASVAGGPPGQEVDPGRVRIHDRVRDKMFYI